MISGSSGFGPPSAGYQQQQQQNPASGLSGASTPVVLACAQVPATSAATDLHAHHHSQDQTPPGGGRDPAKEEESKITFLKDEVRSAGGTTEGSASGGQETASLMPSLKIEDKASRGGRQREDGHGAGGQSPSSHLSTHSAPSTSLPSAPTMESSSPNSLPDPDLDFAQLNVQNTHLDTKVGTRMSPVSTRTGQSNTSLSGSDRSSSRKEAEKTKGSLPGPAADLTSRSTSRGSGMERESFRAGSGPPTSRGVTDMAPTSDLPQDLGAAEDETAAMHAAAKKKTSQNSELPPRTTVRRTMSECSHLAVPTLVAGAYPAGVGGPPMTPNLPDFALMGAISPPRAPYPHVAVRRSLTVTDSTGAAAAWATAMPSSFMTSTLLPSSPPPKRHPGSCETNFLLPVPPHAATSSSQEAENGKR